MSVRPRSATDHLAALHVDADAVLDEIETLVDSLDAATVRRRPGPDRWSVADCLAHLVAIGHAYHPRVRAALAQWDSRASTTGAPRDGEYRPSWFGRLFIHMSGPNGRNIRIRARGPFVPPPPGDDVVDQFRAIQQQLIALIEGAAFADLQAVRITSPLSRLVTLSLGECLQMLVGHERRHLAQMHDILAELGVERAASAAVARRLAAGEATTRPH